MAEALQFDAETHRYTLGGRVLPSVTQILGLLERFEGVPPAVLEAAREFGSHVHMACDLDNRGVLDEAALDPALRPYLEGWRKFRRESGAEIIDSEFRVCHRALGYAGTADVLAKWKGRPALIDIKSGQVPRTVGPQVAAYAEALASPQIRRIARYCVQLLPNDYRVQALTDPSDWSIFLSCLNLLKWGLRT